MFTVFYFEVCDVGIGRTGEGSNDYGQRDLYRYQIQIVDYVAHILSLEFHFLVTKYNSL